VISVSSFSLSLCGYVWKERSGDRMPPVVTRLTTSETPPTYNSVNKYTEVFQVLVDSYGFARYGEINPGQYFFITEILS
jgi:V-type H+-transporting ATPase subunit a